VAADQGRAPGIAGSLPALLLKVPEWFPVPDGVIEAVLRPFIEESIATSQRGVIERLQGRLGGPK